MCPGAISRADNEIEICPVCGAAESLCMLPEEEQVEVIAKIEAAEIKAGRVEKLLL